MKSGVVTALEDTAQKMEKTLADDAGQAVSKLYKDTHEGLEKSLKNHVENDAEHASSLKKYFIDDSGAVKEIKNGKLHDLDPKDKSGIHSLMDAEKKKVKDPTPQDMEKKYHAKKNAKNPDEGVKSTKIKSPTELSSAVEEARRANVNKKGKSDYGGTNYAALKYKDADGHEFILVGQSGYNRSHSERSIGKPLLGGKEGNIKELYTERAPCQDGPNCNRWMGRHIAPNSPDLKVTHGVDYDSSVPTKDRDWGHRAYLQGLKNDHAKQEYGGTMGPTNFDDAGQELKRQADLKRKPAPDSSGQDGSAGVKPPRKRARKGK